MSNIHLLNKEFNKVVCINLAERKDKKLIIEKKFSELGIDVEWYTSVQFGFIPKIINPIVNSKVGHFNLQQPYEIGAAIAHYHVIKQALIEGVERLFVFEDDIKFHNDFNNKLDIYWNDLNSNWDMILLYSFMYDLLSENVRVSKRWLKSFRSWSLMAYGMNRKSMEEYIKRQDNFFTIADLVSYQMQDDSKLNIYSAVPALCIPDTKIISNIRGTSMNYKDNPTIINLGYPETNYK